jgi:hypothetical protein
LLLQLTGINVQKKANKTTIAAFANATFANTAAAAAAEMVFGIIAGIILRVVAIARIAA